MKDIKSLHQKKYRESRGLFLVEGDRSVREAMASEFSIEKIYAVETWSGAHSSDAEGLNIQTVSDRELNQISSLQHPKEAIAVIRLPDRSKTSVELKGNWHIYLDRVRDPGNMGTILRIADWYGMTKLLCSLDCVEIFNQKVIQSSMGAIFRVEVSYLKSGELIELAAKESIPLFGAIMDGDSIYEEPAGDEGVLMMGNEGSGLGPELISASNKLVSIPGKGGAESLNVAVSSGILADWIHRSLHRSGS